MQTVGTNGLTVTGSAITTTADGGDVLLTSTGTNAYQFSFTNLTISFNNTPNGTSVGGITFNSDPGQTDNMEYFSNGAAPITTGTVPPAPCFATGTEITTAEGRIAVEHLAVGDMALTTSGTYSRVRWIGHRTVDCERHPKPRDVMPVRIAAHAFAANAPARDLVLSPGHAVCVDVGGEVLIPAGALVNDTSVVRLDVETVTYWHVELEAHDVLLAENLPCESYLDMGNRGFFVISGVVHLGALPDAAGRTHADFCRPFHESGAIVDAVRARLEARAAASERHEARAA